jgi:hypothetical protein
MSPNQPKMRKMRENSMKKDRVTEEIDMRVTKKNQILILLTIPQNTTSEIEEKEVAMTGEDGAMTIMTRIETQMVVTTGGMTRIIAGMDTSREIEERKSTGVMVMMIEIAETGTMIEMITMTVRGEVLIEGAIIIGVGVMIGGAEVAEAEVAAHLEVIVIDENHCQTQMSNF